MNRVSLRKAPFLAALLTAFSLVSCTGNGPVSGETVSPAKREDAVTVEMFGHLDNAFLPFLNAMDQQFPHIRIQYEYQWDTAGTAEPQRRMLHGDGPDLCIVNGDYLASMSERGLLLNLTNEPFSSKYHVSVMSQANDDGQVYGLPLPGYMQCLLYNKKILEEHGVSELPQSVPDLLEVCEKLYAEGQKAIFVDESLYQMLLQTYYLVYPAGYEWLKQFQQGASSIKGSPAEEVWDVMERFCRVSGCTPEDASAVPAKKTALFLSGEYAFRASSTSMISYIQQASPEFEAGVLPLLGKTNADQWLTYFLGENNVFYFAANAELNQPGNAAKRQAVISLLDWISTREGQQRLVSCQASAVSYVGGVALETDGALHALLPTIQAGHVASVRSLGRGTLSAAGNCVVSMLERDMIASEAVNFCDAQNASELASVDEPAPEDPVIGFSRDPIIWRKAAAVTVGSPMAQLAAIAMAEEFEQADFAFNMAKNVTSSLYPGDVALSDVDACTNTAEDEELMLVEASGRRIKEVIDAGIGSVIPATMINPYGIAGAGRLVHPGGLTYRADAAQDPGDKVSDIRLTGGELLELDETYTVVVSKLMIDDVNEPNFKDCPATGTGEHLEDVLTRYIQTHGEISAPEIAFHIDGAKPLYTLP